MARPSLYKLWRVAGSSRSSQSTPVVGSGFTEGTMVLRQSFLRLAESPHEDNPKDGNSQRKLRNTQAKSLPKI